MKKQSAGILLYRHKGGVPEVFLVHPGGPFWKNKDAGSWTIPKGEPNGEEETLDAAVREFFEETGYRPEGPFAALSPVVQKGGKTVYAWAAAGDLDAAGLVSNEFEMEWPPKSGKMKRFPEVDKGEWFGMEEAAGKINAAQAGLLEELKKNLNL